MKAKLGHYEIQSELGRGGMGVVHKGFDPTLGRSVAIKVLSEALSHDAAVVERFTREAKSMAALNNPHILQIYYIGEDDGQPFFVMEFVEGQTLAQRIKREGRLSVSEALRILRETAEGLGAAHARGVIHRDIKPGNLMLTREGHVRIADFGIAMVQDIKERLTNTGEFVGTPGYLSPEICIGQPIDHRSDIFALGIVLYEMLTGSLPFEDASPLGMMVKVVKSEVPDIRALNNSVDERTCAILNRMIAKDPARRYQSCQEILADLAGHNPVSSPGVASAAFVAATQSLSTLPTQVIAANAPTVAFPTPAPVAPIAIASPPPAILPARAQPRSRGPAFAVAVVLVLGIGAAAALTLRGGGAPTESPATTSASTEQPAVVPPAAETPDQRPSTSVTPPAQIAPAVTAAAAAAPAAATPAPEPAAPAAAAAKKSDPIRIAKVTAAPAAKAAAAPRAPRVVVVAAGDPAIGSPAERKIEDALHDRGVEVLDESLFSGYSRMERRGRVDVAELGEFLRSNGADVLVLAEVVNTGQRTLEYYGRTSTLYTTNLNVRAVLLSERRALGRGWSRKVEFTEFNAEAQANDAVAPVLGEITDSLVGVTVRD